MLEAEKIFVSGHAGMVGSAIVRRLLAQGTAPSQLITRSHAELDLCNQQAVQDFFSSNSIGQVYLAAAKVGGIYSNDTFPAEFIYQNLMIQSNVIHAAHVYGVQKLLFLGSSCIYPRMASQPMREDALLSGPLEPTNEPYAIAKIAGIKLCESYNRQYGRDYRSVMPTNLYGPGDNYHPQNSHVIPAMIRRFHEAKLSDAPEVVIWGTGTPRREFLYTDDMAEASVFVMNLPSSTFGSVTSPTQSHLNVGYGADLTVAELAQAVSEAVGYQGKVSFDISKPDGAPRKWMDSGRLNGLGWLPKTALHAGLQTVYSDFVQNHV